ncbi:tripartite tricarboxylate transporter substrate binding protein [Rhodoferax sp. BAB1]|uniref:Bug family tripartite tricarboxylate transporter substrate binding protein n=1 Tax=Rhodoferax sp. BAB1 TaxID=2741720 RepID=UPI001576ED8A|nr:tripartite tricarboxylate transporter substrate binding protein [Rhodoferax sp. BAB1]QKO20664.1 tripartite tricarboxylate transporter substrate binding protein [Rhodoferax sp. BAB1]
MNEIQHPTHLKRRDIVRALPAAALLGLTPMAWAQGAYPNRPLRVIVPQPPGGGFDFVARQLAERLSRQIGQGVVVENKTGSGTLVGTEAAAQAAPDGYTLLMGSVSNIALNMGLYEKLSYDSLRDFEPVGLAVSYSYTLTARQDLPLNTLKDVVAYAKANPGKLTYASAGNGSGQHVLAAALWHLAGVNVVHVPYRGAQAAYMDMLGGRVDLFFDLSSTARAQIEGGKIKPLALSGAERNPMHPDVPTITESGVAQLDLESWFGYFVPSKTPADVQERLRSELAKVIAQPELQETFRKAGGKPLTLNTEQTRALVKRDVDRWTKLVREIGIKAS